MDRRLENTVIAGIVIGVAILAVTGAMMNSILRREIAISIEARRVTEGLMESMHVVSSLKDAETGQRGFLLTGGDEYLEPYNTGRRNALTALTRLRGLLDESKLPAEDFERLAQLADAKIAELEQTILLKQSNNHVQALARVQSGEGIRLMDDLRLVAAKFERVGMSMRSRMTGELDELRQQALLVGMVGMAILLSFLALFGVMVLRGVRRLRAAEAALRGNERFSRSVLDSSADCIKVMDLEGHLLSINAPGLKLMEIDSLETAPHRPWPSMWGEAEPKAREAISTAISGGTARFQGFRKTAKGTPKWWDVQVTPVLDDDGKVTRLLAVLRDITSTKAAEKEKESLLAAEQAARSDAERASRVKDEFVATLSHELRTPLNAILGWSQLLRKGPAQGDDLQEGLQTIERNARVQSQMIEDLLDMSRIISGKIRLDIQRVDLLEVINAAIDVVKPAANARGVRLESMLDPRTNLVNGDPTRLQQVMWNLVSNAVKFTPKGGKVQVVLRRINSHIELAVSDTGKGIRPEFLPHVFERFRQEDASTTRTSGGLGLGLAIVKQLTELHGGTVRCASEGEGLGATFTVELPLAVLHEQPRREGLVHPTTPHATATPSAPHVDLRDVRVLVVDDEADSRGLVKRILTEAHAEVAMADSVNAALRLFDEFRPMVVLSDIGMPERDGYDLIRTIRERGPGEGGRTPAAALSALARSEDRTRAMMAGYQLHIAKPVEASELLAAVVTLSKLHPGRTPAASRT